MSTQLIACDACGTTNRVPTEKLAGSGMAVCGRCKSPLPNHSEGTDGGQSASDLGTYIERGEGGQTMTIKAGVRGDLRSGWKRQALLGAVHELLLIVLFTVHVLFGKIKTIRWGSLSANQRAGLLFPLGFLVVVVLFVEYEEYDKHEQQRIFNAMTPAEHLKKAQSNFGAGLYGLAIRHARAITSGPEVSEARKIEQEASAARDADAQRLQAAREVEAQSIHEAQLAEENRRTALLNLQSELKNLGYDLTVSQSDRPGEMVITSKDFSDTDHRVRFLSFLRGRNSPTARVCFAGFQNVRLKDSGSFFGFSELYSLECFSFR